MATNKQECKHTHPHVQCSPASVGSLRLAQITLTPAS